MKKEIRRPRGSSPLILLLGLCLGWTAWAGGEGEHEAGPEPGELPQEVLGDSPPSDPFQDTADLRRAREAIYGQTLSEDQHRRIEGWKVMDSTWWLDPTRRTESSSLRDSIRQMLDEVPKEGLDLALQADSDCFGISLLPATSPDGAPVPSGERVWVTIDSLRRPDLFDIYEEIDRLFRLHLEEEGHELIGDKLLTRVGGRLREKIGDDEWTALRVRTDQALRQYPLDRDQLSQDRLEVEFHAEMAPHFTSGGATYDAAESRRLQSLREEASWTSLREAVWHFFTAVGPELSDELVRYVVESLAHQPRFQAWTERVGEDRRQALEDEKNLMASTTVE